MRKINLVLLTICFLFSGIVSARNKNHNPYNAPVKVDAIGFNAVYQNGAVSTSWKQYLRDDLKYYKVVKSNSNPNPIYPEDGYIFYSQNPQDTSFIDTKIKPGIWYYRLCIITKQNNRWVSPVIKVIAQQVGSKPPSNKDFK